MRLKSSRCATARWTVLPALRPLMEPGATPTGQGTQLIVRASPANLPVQARARGDRLARAPPADLGALRRGARQRRPGEEASGVSSSNRGSQIEVQARTRSVLAPAGRPARTGPEGGRAFIYRSIDPDLRRQRDARHRNGLRRHSAADRKHGAGWRSCSGARRGRTAGPRPP